MLDENKNCIYLIKVQTYLKLIMLPWQIFNFSILLRLIIIKFLGLRFLLFISFILLSFPTTFGMPLNDLYTLQP